MSMWIPIPQDKDDPNVRAARWDAGTLYVQFHATRNGLHRVYAYLGVDKRVLDSLCSAESPDRFHHEQIKGTYPWMEITGSPIHRALGE